MILQKSGDPGGTGGDVRSVRISRHASALRDAGAAPRLVRPNLDAMTYAGDLTPPEAWELLDRDPEAVLVDVRTEAEWLFVGVPDLTPVGKKLVTVSWNHWPQGTRNDSFLEELTAAGVTGEGPVLFICRSGARSRSAAVLATGAGIAPSYNVSEGFEGDLDEVGRRGGNGWRAAGLPWRQS
jgi:rhodanese-related sulfurtransferase